MMMMMMMVMTVTMTMTMMTMMIIDNLGQKSEPLNLEFIVVTVHYASVKVIT